MLAPSEALYDRIRAVPTLEALYRETDRLELTPGWVEREVPINLREPKSRFAPAHWEYAECKAALDAAGRLMDVALAERRNLLLRAPLRGNNFATTNTIVCAYQMILPGEFAPCHRHSPHALRVIIEAEGAYSVVDGERTPMETGDVVLTPGGHWHSHGHDGDRSAYWLDVLDVPLVHLLENMCFEDYPDRAGPPARVVAESDFRFPAAALRRALDRAEPDPEGYNGRRVVLAAPSMPTMTLAVERLETGQRTRRYRSTASRIVSVIEGRGSTTIGDRRFDWRRGDTFTIPSSVAVEHTAAADSTLFEASDEALMRFGNFYRFSGD